MDDDHNVVQQQELHKYKIITQIQFQNNINKLIFCISFIFPLAILSYNNLTTDIYNNEVFKGGGE